MDGRLSEWKEGFQNVCKGLQNGRKVSKWKEGLKRWKVSEWMEGVFQDGRKVFIDGREV